MFQETPNDNNDGETTTKPTIKKREFEKKTIKSILPAPLNNENKLNSNIKSNNEKLLSLSKQEAEVIKKIKMASYEVNIKRVLKKEGTAVGLANGVLNADGKTIYTAENLKVGLFKS